MAEMALYSIEDAPKDGRILLLMVDYAGGGGPLDDSAVSWTIGFNTLLNTGYDKWHIAGWDSTHDCFCEGDGTPIGWLPWEHALEHIAGTAEAVPIAPVMYGGDGPDIGDLDDAPEAGTADPTVDALIKALEPFAALADEVEALAAKSDTRPEAWARSSEWADLVAARAALAKARGDGQ